VRPTGQLAVWRNLAHFVLGWAGMLRRIVLLGGLMTASCVLGGGIDIPSSGTSPNDGGINLDGGSEGSMDGGLTEGPPTGVDGAGSGGTPCCLKLNMAGLDGGAGLGGLGGASP
jgi:hypothetical protein